MARHTLVIIPLIAFAAVNGAAQSYRASWYGDLFGENTGHTVCTFLTLPVSAGTPGIWGAASTGMMDATDVAYYTANTGLAEKNQFALTHLEWPFGLRKEFAAAAFPLMDIGTVGVYTQMFTSASDPYARTITEQPSKAPFLEFSGGGSFARTFLDRVLSAGGAIYYVQSRLDDCIGRAIAASADLRYFPSNRIDAAFYIRHFGTDITYTATPEPLPLQIGAAVSWYPVQKTYPESGIFNAVAVTGGAEKTADEPVVFGLASQWKPVRWMAVRAGYEYPLGTDASIAGASAGVSFSVKNYGIDGAWRYLSPLFGSVWSATARMEIETFSPRSAEDYCTLAQQSFNEMHYKECIHYAEKAVKLDPNLWKAHTLISRAQSEIWRREKTEIALIYTGNIRGQFLAPPTAGAVGGLARQAAAITVLRSQFPLSISVASGNFIAGTPNAAKNAIAARYYRYIKNDAVGIGEGELETGLGQFLAPDSGRTVFLCSDGASLGFTNVVSRTIVERDGYSCAVISVVNHPLLTINLTKRGSSLMDELSLDLKRGDVMKSNLRVVIIHDSWNNIREYAAALQGADVAICGSLEQRFETPMKIGSCLAVSAGGGCQFVGCLTLRFNKQKRIVSWDNRLVPLTIDIAEDSAVAKMVSIIAARSRPGEKALTPLPAKKGNAEGVFPFISNRSGNAGLYLKIPDKFAEFPLNPGAAVAGTPACSFFAGKIAFIRDDTASGCRPLVTIDLSGANKRVCADSCVVTEALFSPDGRWLYCAASTSCEDSLTDLYRTLPDSGVMLPVVAWKKSAENGMAFSPDFSELVFCSDRDGSRQLYLTNPEGERPLRLTDASGNHTRPGFSPDGACIAYCSDQDNIHGGTDLWVFDRSSGKHRPLTRDSWVTGYCWIDSSNKIVYSSGIDFPELMTVDVATGQTAKLITSPASSRKSKETDPRFIVFKDGGKIVYVREFENHERHIYRVSPDGSGDQCIVRSSGSDWLGR